MRESEEQTRPLYQVLLIRTSWGSARSRWPSRSSRSSSPCSRSP